ncbi:ferritin-like domain-containing protein [Reyranella sp.]|uniref:ferritin-like domain-containing protein n=1 Tax=Reyranella sp. TaxID=1929291 RepID=UPI003C7E8560
MAGPREYLIHLLTEAAEIEHNLLCSYLYAAFSLKARDCDSLTVDEGVVVGGWRKSIVGVAIEEMGHLAQVNNLLVAVGGAPQFDRPNLPVPPGYHPASFVIRLAPFSRETLKHFIFLERPAQAKVRDADRDYRHNGPARQPTPGGLVPSTPDYETIGEFYDEIRSALDALGKASGEDAFVASSQVRQLSPEDIQISGLRVIRHMDDALQALEAIVEQGEGSSCEKEDCHYRRFLGISREWDDALEANPGFVPYHAAAVNPVMRPPAKGLDRVWVTEPAAAALLDFGNALYGLTLTLLAYVCGRSGQSPAAHRWGDAADACAFGDRLCLGVHARRRRRRRQCRPDVRGTAQSPLIAARPCRSLSAREARKALLGSDRTWRARYCLDRS